MHHNIIVKHSRPFRFPNTVFCLLLLLTTSCTNVNQWFGTPTPRATPTLEPTLTATPTNTPVPTTTATPDPYAIDLEKLSHTPPSYDYLLAHLDEFVQAPDPMIVGMDEFFQWYEDRLVPAMGERQDRDVNIFASSMSTGSDRYVWCQPGCQIGGQIEFFYFESNTTVYPVYVLTISYRSENSAPFSIIITDGRGMHGLGVLDIIENTVGQYFGQGCIYGSPNEFFSDDVNEMISLGLNPARMLPSRAVIGFGELNFSSTP